MKQEIYTREQLEEALRPALTAKGLTAPRYAVVIPVIWHDDREPEILLEVRAAGISQSGDPCFPGGHIEPGEDPAATALRELREELSITADPAHLLGQLPTVQTSLGRRTNVYVCTLSEEEAAQLNASRDEVAEVLQVPVSFFLKEPHAMDYIVRGNCIWGMTAGGINHFCDAWNRC